MADGQDPLTESHLPFHPPREIGAFFLGRGDRIPPTRLAKGVTMRHTIVFLFLTVGLCGCASLTPDGARVKVYEADLAAPESSRALPRGCKLISTTAPADQMESERHISDPYRLERNDTAGRGGNVLLVLSTRFVTRYKTDCAGGDNSPDCQNRAQNWYKVAFASYVCDPEAQQALDQAAPARSGAPASWWPFGKKASAPASAPSAAKVETAAPSPASAPPNAASETLKTKVLSLMRERVGSDVILAYVRANRLAAPLTAEEIVEWKRAGISDEAIRATFPD